MDYTRLYREQHLRIKRLCVPLLAGARATASSAALRTALARLAGVVKLHLRDEDARLYPRLITQGSAPLREMATAFQSEMGGLAGDFTRYYAAWVAAGRIEADPRRFFDETDDVLGRLLLRIEREDAELYGLADAERVDSA